jgi:hypothetical protein
LAILYFHLYLSQPPAGFGHHDVPTGRKCEGDRGVIHRGLVVFPEKLARVIREPDRTARRAEGAVVLRFVIAFTVDNEQPLRPEQSL